jgi:hypothetical protein
VRAVVREFSGVDAESAASARVLAAAMVDGLVLRRARVDRFSAQEVLAAAVWRWGVSAPRTVGVLRYVTGLASAPVEVLFGRVRQWVLDLPVVDLPQGRQLRVVWDSELAMPVSRVLRGVAVAEPGAMGNLVRNVLEVVSRSLILTGCRVSLMPPPV